MDRQPVKSSLIASTAHDPTTSTLEVEFTDGQRWRYAGVSAEAHENMRAADSVGRHFLQNIKGAFEGSRVEEKKEGDA